MERRKQNASARLGQHMERLLVALVWLDPRLVAAYQVTISETPVSGNRRPPGVSDARASITDRRLPAPGVVA